MLDKNDAEQNTVGVGVTGDTKKTDWFLSDKSHSLHIRTLRNQFSYTLIMGYFISHTNQVTYCSNTLPSK